ITVPLMTGQDQPETLTYSELIDAFDSGAVATIEIVSSRDLVQGRFVGSALPEGQFDFVTVVPAASTESLVGRAEDGGAAVAFQSARRSELYRSAFAVLLQILLFGGLGYFVYVQTRGEGRGQVGRLSQSDTTFDDVAGTQ